MRLTELVLVCAWSSLGVSFPWYVWVLCGLDILVRIADDHKEYLRNRQIDIVREIATLEEKMNGLNREVAEKENKKKGF